MRKEFVSTEIRKSIETNGSKPELLGEIIKKAIRKSKGNQTFGEKDSNI